MKWVMAAMAGLAGMAGQAAAQTEAPIDVMVVGTYHFDNPGRDLNNPKADDVLKPERQKELQALASALAAFRPTKIMVERVAKSADLVDPRYGEFTPAELARNRDERVQVAYRLANRLGHKSVYAIDEQPGEGEPDYFPFGKLMAWAQANGAEPRIQALMGEGAAITKWIEQLQKEGTVGHALREINRPARTAKDQAFYYELLKFGDTEQQPGADLNAMWYLRTAKIFAKLAKAAEPGDRILVVYGSGHNYWLRHFAASTPGFRNVDPLPYLKAAAAK